MFVFGNGICINIDEFQKWNCDIEIINNFVEVLQIYFYFRDKVFILFYLLNVNIWYIMLI